VRLVQSVLWHVSASGEGDDAGSIVLNDVGHPRWITFDRKIVSRTGIADL